MQGCMEIATDLHAHSAFAGGARGGGKSKEEQLKKVMKRFKETALYSPLKGIQLIGTGDAQYEPWLEFICENLEENNGIFQTSFAIEGDSSFDLLSKNHEYEQPRYILQTEIIFTGPVKNSRKRKTTHVVILFPSTATIQQFNELLDRWGVARKNMARPFVVCDSVEMIEKRIFAIMDLDLWIEVIPAHVLTPEGVYGGSERINCLSDFFGAAARNIHAVETGLSGDPMTMGIIPELDDIALVSNSDAHSSALNRIGREFTIYETNKTLETVRYNDIIQAIRSKKIAKTGEFHPTEGRYFLTGHRAGRSKPGNHEKHEYCFFSPSHVPENDMCPICNKQLTIGVLQRVFEISAYQNEGKARKLGEGPKRNYITMVPLVEIIAHSLNIKTVSSKTVLRTYGKVMDVVGNEVALWTTDKAIDDLRTSAIDNQLVEAIEEVKRGNFSFLPLGYDGEYGKLQIGKTIDFEDISVINR